jgi:hypothetical protein
VQTQNNQSEVARIREAIDAEYRGASMGFLWIRLGIPQHRFITKRMERIANYIEALSEIADETTMKQVFDQLGE